MRKAKISAICVLLFINIIAICSCTYNKKESGNTSYKLNNSVIDIDSDNEEYVFTFNDVYDGHKFSKTLSNENILEAFKIKADEEHVKILSSSEKRIILLKNLNLISFTNKNGKFIEDGVLDLKKISGEFDRENISFSIGPNSKYVICNLLNTNDKIAHMYLCDIENSSATLIGKQNCNYIIDNWSKNSQFYAYGDKDGDSINIFDLNTNETFKIPFHKGKVKDLFITNKGDLYIKSNKKYILRKEKKYNILEANIPGIFLSAGENCILYFDGGTIYKYEQGQTEEIKKIGEDFVVVNTTFDKCILSDENQTIIYNSKTNTTNKYAFKYEYQNMVIPNNSGDKCFIYSSRNNSRVLGSNGQYYRIDYKILEEFIGRGKWYGEEYLIKVLRNNDKFMFLRLNVENGEVDIL